MPYNNETRIPLGTPIISAQGVPICNANKEPLLISRLSDTTIPISAHVKPGPGRRHHKAFLSNMYGTALTVLDEEGRIMFFAAAALRRREEEHDCVLSMSVEQLFQGITGWNNDRVTYQPEYEVIKIAGQDRHRDYPLVFREFPYVTTYLSGAMPEAAGWGIMRFGPSAHKMFIGANPNGTNSELWLDNDTWKDALEAGAVHGSGSNDLTARLHPRAIELAQSIPSAWSLAVTSAYLFGGMTKVPTVTPIKSSPLITAMITDEGNVRTRKKAQLQVARIEREMQRHAQTATGSREMDVLRAALNPEQFAGVVPVDEDAAG